MTGPIRARHTFGGKVYKLVPEQNAHTCDGCVFDQDVPGCARAGSSCVSQDCIWVREEEPVVYPDVTGPHPPNPVIQVASMAGVHDTKPDNDMKETNPKTSVGDKKVPLALLSPIASAHWSLAQYAGMLKYQAWNWRIAGVRSSTYISAMKRHLDKYISGEEYDAVDGTHHLGNIMACAAILLDAQAAGKLNDDRPPSVAVDETYAFVENQMAVLREKYKHIEQKPFTIADTVK